MKRFIEGVDRSQTTLFPDRLEDWIDVGWCQANANQSPKAPTPVPSGSQLMPISQGS